jgi:hypothetical protein
MSAHGTTVPDGYEAEYTAIMGEAADAVIWRETGVMGLAELLVREIVALKARLDKLEAAGQPVKEGGE